MLYTSLQIRRVLHWTAIWIVTNKSVTIISNPPHGPGSSSVRTHGLPGVSQSLRRPHTCIYVRPIFSDKRSWVHRKSRRTKTQRWHSGQVLSQGFLQAKPRSYVLTSGTKFWTSPNSRFENLSRLLFTSHFNTKRIKISDYPEKPSWHYFFNFQHKLNCY